MTRISKTAREIIVMDLAVARDRHRTQYSGGLNVDGEIRPVGMRHLDVLVDALVRRGFDVARMSRKQLDGLLVEFDAMEARDASNARIGLPDRRVALAPTYRRGAA